MGDPHIVPKGSDFGFNHLERKADAFQGQALAFRVIEEVFALPDERAQDRFVVEVVVEISKISLLLLAEKIDRIPLGNQLSEDRMIVLNASVQDKHSRIKTA